MDNNSPPYSIQDSKAIQVSSKVMITSVVLIFIVITLMLIIHIYFKWHMSRSRRRRLALITADIDPQLSSTRRRGLDRKTLESLPVIMYNSKDFKEGLECAVCLSEAEEGEKMRWLPDCKHGFHVDCIDMWFQSHKTCPLCRNPVVMRVRQSDSICIEIGVSLSIDASPSDHDDGQGAESSRGEEQGAASGSSSSGNEDVRRGEGRGSLVIDIPKRVLPTEICSSRLTTPMGPISSGSTKSPSTPMSTRLKTLKRLLSRGKRVVQVPSTCGTSSSSSEHDIGVHHHQVEQV